MLLETQGLEGDHARVCDECYHDLKSSDSWNVPPRFSLANNLWIGLVPECLQILTLPETLLISLIYPHVFVYKLFPKRNSHVDSSQLQNGMRGSVTSYEQDIQGVSDMIQGNLLPRPLPILASLITVTFVGPGKLNPNWLRYTFRVCRQVVKVALQWLIAHNRHYSRF